MTTTTINVHRGGEIPVDQRTGNVSYEKKIDALLRTKPRKKKMIHSSEPVVAFDIDGVIANFNAAMKPYSKVAHTEETSPQFYDFVRSGWFDTWNDFEDAHLDVMDKAYDIPLLDSTAGDAMRMLHNNGCKVIVVTARREMWRDATLKFFDKHGIPVTSDNLFFMDRKKKTDIHFDYIVDDSPKNIADVLEHSDAQVSVYDQRYNKDINTRRVNSLMDFAHNIMCDISS